MKTAIISLLVGLALCTTAVAVELPATLILRMNGNPDSGQYVSGYSAENKGNFGYAKGNKWKAVVVFDGISAVDLADKDLPVSLKLTADWIKEPDNVRDAKITYIGTTDAIDVRDDVWRPKYAVEGTEIGTISSSELSQLKSSTPFEFEGTIDLDELSPANRYILFRIESPVPEDRDVNSMGGLSTLLSNHSLSIGASSSSEPGSGGY